MSDVLETYGVRTHIHSLDIVKVSTIEHSRITFHEGSGRALGDVFPADMIESCLRPFLIIDDADHAYETSKAVLEHFHPHMRPGEYLIVEDGLSAPGPRQALTEFLPAHADEWKVDSDYCDFFGYNATWCLNGFLRRIA
jgi:cephalosporin hydroxylase